MKVVVVPEWLKRSLESNSRDLGDALEPEKLLDIISLDDVAFYLFLNDRSLHGSRPSGVFGDIFGTFTSAISMADIEGKVPAKDRETLFSLTNSFIGADCPISVTRLFGPFVNESDLKQCGYELRVINRDVLAIVPNVMGEPSQTEQNLVDDLLYHLSTRVTFETLAGTPLFQRFLACCMI